MFGDKKLRTREELKQELESRLRTFRLDTCRAKKIPKWSKGRLFRLHNEDILTFCTNYPSVHHLNLEEMALLYGTLSDLEVYQNNQFQFSFCTNHPSVEYLNLEEIATRCGSIELLSAEHRFPIPAKRYPLQRYQLLPPVLHHCLKLHAASEGIQVSHRVSFNEITGVDREIIGLMCLLDRWDDRKFMRLLLHYGPDHVFSHIYMEDPVVIDLQSYLEILLACCADSTFIVEVLKKISTYVNYEFLIHFPSSYMRLLNWHLKKVYTEYFDSVIAVDWLNNEDLLLDALFFGDVKTIKFALELEWPSKLLPFTVPLDATSIPGSWSLKKDGVAVRSFNSLEYFRTFTWSLVKTVIPILKYYTTPEVKSNIATCIQLIWRAIPTPYLPIDNMLQCADLHSFIGERHHDRSQEIETELRSVLQDGYEEGCPSLLEPRSLTQLSKCAIRRRCRSPAQISLLPLPERMKKYVNLDTDCPSSETNALPIENATLDTEMQIENRNY